MKPLHKALRGTRGTGGGGEEREWGGATGATVRKKHASLIGVSCRMRGAGGARMRGTPPSLSGSGLAAGSACFPPRFFL